ncbi:hypothetical protein A4_323 [Escherichia phage A4]|nr:hypothetical protein A4_323 [Escherichia phage A4]
MKILSGYEYYSLLRTIQAKVSSISLDKSIAQVDKCVIITEMKLSIFIGTNYQSIYTDAWLASLRNKVISRE